MMDANTIKIMTSSDRQDYGTPRELFEAVERLFIKASGRRFELDACAHADNTKCDRYFNAKENGLIQDFGALNTWMNPPFKYAAEWVKKAYEESTRGARVAVCIPARMDANWFINYAWKAAELRFLTRRVKFTGATDQAPFPVVILVYDRDLPAKSFCGPWDYEKETERLTQPDFFAEDGPIATASEVIG